MPHHFITIRAIGTSNAVPSLADHETRHRTVSGALRRLRAIKRAGMRPAINGQPVASDWLDYMLASIRPGGTAAGGEGNVAELELAGLISQPANRLSVWSYFID